MFNSVLFVFNQIAFIVTVLIIGFIVVTFLYVLLRTCFDIWRYW